MCVCVCVCIYIYIYIHKLCKKKYFQCRLQKSSKKNSLINCLICYILFYLRQHTNTIAITPKSPLFFINRILSHQTIR